MITQQTANAAVGLLLIGNVKVCTGQINIYYKCFNTSVLLKWELHCCLVLWTPIIPIASEVVSIWGGEDGRVGVNTAANKHLICHFYYQLAHLQPYCSHRISLYLVHMNGLLSQSNVHLLDFFFFIVSFFLWQANVVKSTSKKVKTILTQGLDTST